MVTLVLLFVVILLIREIAMNDRDPLGAFQLSEAPPENVQPVSTRTSSLGPREIQLYFSAPDGHYLAPEKREVEYSESTVENCKTVLNALIEGPRTELRPIVHSSVKVKSMFLLTHGELVINFSRELQSEHTRFSSATLESLMVQGIVQTLSQTSLQNTRDPKVRRVRFLIEDATPTEAFPAHIDLSEPVAPDGQWLTAQR